MKMVSKELLEDVKYSEGFKLEPYEDDKGILTIGYGTNISKITKTEAEMLLSFRLKIAVDEVGSVFGYEVINRMTENQKDALYELMYWVGLPTFNEFKNMIKATKAYDWQLAGSELLDSKLGREYKTRANRLANKLKGY